MWGLWPKLSLLAVQVVSYADLKKCMAGAFGELQVASQRSTISS